MIQYFVFHALSLKTKCLAISHSPPHNDGVRCAFFMHVGSPSSPYNNAVKSVEDLMKVSKHIDKVLNAKNV